jgi:hypothetical protein
LNVDENLQAGDIALAEGIIKGYCSLARLDLSSCVDEKRVPMFKVLDKTRKIWFCNQQKIYWIFEVPEEKSEYICPLILYDQSGAEVRKNIKVIGFTQKKEDIVIEGLDQTLVGENFTFKTDKTGLFFSPNFTEYVESNQLVFSIKKPGKYLFYFYSDGQKGEKTIEILSTKDIQILSVDKPKSVKLGSWFLVNASLKNLLNISLDATIKLNFEDQTFSKILEFRPKEEKFIYFNLTPHSTGKQEILLITEGKSIFSYSAGIEVQKEMGFIEKIVSFILNFLSELVRIIKNVFSSPRR